MHSAQNSFIFYTFLMIKHCTENTCVLIASFRRSVSWGTTERLSEEARVVDMV